jgi:hypothetical protein
MQKGSLIRSSRRQGPDVWEYRWRESCSGKTRRHRRIVIGTINTLKDETAALKAIAALRRDININDRRLSTKPLRLAELVEHYRQRELAEDNEWKTLSTRVTYEGYLRKWIVPRGEQPILARSGRSRLNCGSARFHSPELVAPRFVI